jgi:hypothetical protein
MSRQGDDGAAQDPTRQREARPSAIVGPGMDSPALSLTPDTPSPGAFSPAAHAQPQATPTLSGILWAPAMSSLSISSIGAESASVPVDDPFELPPVSSAGAADTTGPAGPVHLQESGDRGFVEDAQRPHVCRRCAQMRGVRRCPTLGNSTYPRAMRGVEILMPACERRMQSTALNGLAAPGDGMTLGDVREQAMWRPMAEFTAEIEAAYLRICPGPRGVNRVATVKAKAAADTAFLQHEPEGARLYLIDCLVSNALSDLILSARPGDLLPDEFTDVA